MKIAQKIKRSQRKMRHKRVRAKVAGDSSRPRLNVFRSSKYLYAQIIDDVSGKTLVSASSKEVKGKKNKTGQAEALGELLAKKAKESKVGKVVFDRGGFTYHGRIRAFAEAARKGGLNF